MNQNSMEERIPSAADRRFDMWVYALGMMFIVVMIVMYMKADIMLGWLESIVRTLFL